MNKTKKTKKSKLASESDIKIDATNEIKDIELYDVYIKTVQATAIKILIEALKEVLIEAYIHFNANGLRINRMDNKEKAIIYVNLDASKFETFYCPKPIIIGVSIISLHKLLKTVTNSDIITLFVKKDSPEKFCIKVENRDKKIKINSELNLIEFDDKRIKIPDIEYESMFQMPCADFQKNCRDLLLISKTVTIKSNNSCFTMHSSGTFANQTIELGDNDNDLLNLHKNTKKTLNTSDIEKTKEEESEGDDEDTEGDKDDEDEIEEEEHVVENTKEMKLIGNYDLKYLCMFCKATNLCPRFDIYLRENLPLILSYSVAALGTLRFMLVPEQNK